MSHKTDPVSIGRMNKGENNCITDVPGVHVGHVTLDEPLDNENGDYACTGVTAILPHNENIFREKVTAASYIINGFGKTTGLIQIDELGLLESPIMLTNTFSIPAVTQGTLEYLLKQNPEIGDTTGTVNTVVGECNDGYLNSIRTFSIQPKHAIEAIENAKTTPSEEGAVGAGKGMVCFGYKGGIGSSSRIVNVQGESISYTIGCLVLSNFGSKQDARIIDPSASKTNDEEAPTSDGSIMIICATNAPMSDRQLRRLSKRCSIGLGRTGGNFHNGSGDIVISFSTAHRHDHFAKSHTEVKTQVRDDHPVMNECFTAAAEACEEAIVRSLQFATATSGKRQRTVLPFYK
ncbi:D-aminopeptidase [Texcoconibacillus texcoconensis]|uniref:D-aminopeptidase n=1 Tax=Texcoconibacillus texcoconensis TaxID=1095777 RepID=A0A840QPB9_9BACI|nr:D-aminopeptidase [Texcoconibacillus texcoconensis]